nr:AbrB family transcriptional regulator [Rhizobium sp. ARZ01]
MPSGLLIGATLAGLLFCRFYKRAQVVPFSLQFMQIVLGISLGVIVGPGDILVASDWLSAAGLTLSCLTLQVGTSYLWLRRVSRWPTADAALASYPGAMAAVP